MHVATCMETSRLDPDSPRFQTLGGGGRRGVNPSRPRRFRVTVSDGSRSVRVSARLLVTVPVSIRVAGWGTNLNHRAGRWGPEIGSAEYHSRGSNTAASPAARPGPPGPGRPVRGSSGAASGSDSDSAESDSESVLGSESQAGDRDSGDSESDDAGNPRPQQCAPCWWHGEWCLPRHGPTGMDASTTCSMAAGLKPHFNGRWGWKLNLT